MFVYIQFREQDCVLPYLAYPGPLINQPKHFEMAANYQNIMSLFF